MLYFYFNLETSQSLFIYRFRGQKEEKETTEGEGISRRSNKPAALQNLCQLVLQEGEESVKVIDSPRQQRCVYAVIFFYNQKRQNKSLIFNLTG